MWTSFICCWHRNNTTTQYGCHWPHHGQEFGLEAVAGVFELSRTQEADDDGQNHHGGLVFGPKVVLLPLSDAAYVLGVDGCVYSEHILLRKDLQLGRLHTYNKPCSTFLTLCDFLLLAMLLLLL